MRYVLGIFVLLCLIGCSSDSKSDSSKEIVQDSANAFDFEAFKAQAGKSGKLADSTTSVATIYLLSGTIDSTPANLFLKITSGEQRQDEPLAKLTGKIMVNGDTFSISGEVDSAFDKNAIPLLVERLNSNDTQILKVNIFDNAQVRGVFKKDGFFKDGAKVAFKKAGAINEIAIVGESVEKKTMGKDYDGSDREFSQRISIQIPSILGEGEAISAINAQLEKAPSFEIEADASHNFEGISSFDIEYIDEKVIVFNNYIYVYSGGAHGSYSNDAVAFSLESGERIANGVRVLLKNEVDKNLMLMIKERLQKEYGSIIDDNPYPSNFKITPEGVEFYWGLYEIAPYAAGIISVKFSLDEIAPYIKEDSPYYYKFKGK